jgi:hypothetical protein
MADLPPPDLFGRQPQIAAGGEFTPQANHLSPLRDFSFESHSFSSWQL